jgi:hypothetical protein
MHDLPDRVGRWLAGPAHMARPSVDEEDEVPSLVVRAAWIVAVILVVVALAAWGTTCTGPRPRPTGDTVPSGPTAQTTATSGLAPAPPGG